MSSPPRKSIRSDGATSAVDGRSANSTNDGNGKKDGNNRNDDRRRESIAPPTPVVLKKIPRPNLQPLLQSFVDVMEQSQNARKQQAEAEANSAKYDRFRGREDISKENKTKADEALQEVANLKKLEIRAKRSVITRLQSLVDVIFDYVIELNTAQREDLLAAMTQRVGEESRVIVTPPRTPSIPSHPGLPPQRPVSIPKSVILPSKPNLEKQIGTTLTGKGKEREANSTKTSALKRLEELENLVMDVQMESEERLNEFESIIREMIQEEVENRIKNARERREKRMEANEGSSSINVMKSARQFQSQAQAQVSTMSPSLNRSEGIRTEPEASGELEEGEIRRLNSQPHPSPPPTRMTVNSVPTPAVPATTTPPLIRKSTPPQIDEANPPMSREQVNAALQSLREEFDTKLFAQETKHRQELEEVTKHWQARFHSSEEKTALALHRHFEVLQNHGELLRRHQAFWQGTIGILSNVPKPTNTS